MKLYSNYCDWFAVSGAESGETRVRVAAGVGGGAVRERGARVAVGRESPAGGAAAAAGAHAARRAHNSTRAARTR